MKTEPNDDETDYWRILKVLDRLHCETHKLLRHRRQGVPESCLPEGCLPEGDLHTLLESLCSVVAKLVQVSPNVMTLASVMLMIGELVTQPPREDDCDPDDPPPDAEEAAQ